MAKNTKPEPWQPTGEDTYGRGGREAGPMWVAPRRTVGSTFAGEDCVDEPRAPRRMPKSISGTY